MTYALGVILWASLILLSFAVLAAPFVAMAFLPLEKWGWPVCCAPAAASLAYGINEVAYKVGKQVIGGGE